MESDKIEEKWFFQNEYLHICRRNFICNDFKVVPFSTYQILSQNNFKVMIKPEYRKKKLGKMLTSLLYVEKQRTRKI